MRHRRAIAQLLVLALALLLVVWLTQAGGSARVAAALRSLLRPGPTTTPAASPPSGFLPLDAGTSPPGRVGAAFVHDPRHGVVLFGGTIGDGTCSPEEWSWEGDTWVLSATDPGLPCVDPHAAVRTATALLVAARCLDCPIETWLNRPPEIAPLPPTPTPSEARWTRFTGPGPSPTLGYAAAEDDDAPANGMVLFMADSAGAAETWVFDGNAWVREHPLHSPPARADAGMAADPQGGVLLFGGSLVAPGDRPRPRTVLGDTWSWNGGDWTELHPAHSPAPRDRATIGSLDSLAGPGVVLFGGTDGGGHYLEDTWMWSAGDWTRVNSRYTPAARVSASMGPDRGDHLLMYGGELNGAPLSDTWLFSPEGGWVWLLG